MRRNVCQQSCVERIESARVIAGLLGQQLDRGL